MWGGWNKTATVEKIDRKVAARGRDARKAGTPSRVSGRRALGGVKEVSTHQQRRLKVKSK